LKENFFKRIWPFPLQKIKAFLYTLIDKKKSVALTTLALHLISTTSFSFAGSLVHLMTMRVTHRQSLPLPESKKRLMK
jgi:hypothetical protein